MRASDGAGPARPGLRIATLLVLGALALAGCGSDKAAEPAAESTVPAGTTGAAPTPVVVSSAPQAGGSVDLEANDRLLDEVADQIDEGAKGFAQVLKNPAKRKLTVYWKGQPPADVKALEGTTPTGVEVVIVAAKLSKADVDAAIQRISQAASAGRLPNPDSISASKDFNSILVGFTKGRLAQYDNASVRSQFEATAKVPVTIGLAGEHALD